MPGSTEPERVPIIRPSSGLKPSVVATAMPLRTAAAEQPPPKWQLIRRSPERSRPNISAARAAQ